MHLATAELQLPAHHAAQGARSALTACHAQLPRARSLHALSRDKWFYRRRGSAPLPLTMLSETRSVRLAYTYLQSLGMTSVSVSDRNTSPWLICSAQSSQNEQDNVSVWASPCLHRQERLAVADLQGARAPLPFTPTSKTDPGFCSAPYSTPQKRRRKQTQGGAGQWMGHGRLGAGRARVAWRWEPLHAVPGAR